MGVKESKEAKRAKVDGDIEKSAIKMAMEGWAKALKDASAEYVA